MIGLKQVKCCATCKNSGGWMDNMLCHFYEIETRPYWICDNYSENEHMVKVKFIPLPNYTDEAIGIAQSAIAELTEKPGNEKNIEWFQKWLDSLKRGSVKPEKGSL